MLKKIKNKIQIKTYIHPTELLTKPIQILQITDLHSTVPQGLYPLLRDLFQRETIDMICLTGDLFDDKAPLDGGKECLQFLSQYMDRDRMFYVTGNHEFRRKDFRQLIDMVQSHAIYLQRKNSPAIRGECTIYGLDDPSNNERDFIYGLEDFSQQIQRDPKPRLSILLSHRPEYFPQYKRAGFSIILSGHAHGGQVRLPLIGGLFAPGQGLFPQYDRGKFEDEKSTLYLSSGCTSKSYCIPRLWNPPEVLLLRCIPKT